MRLFAAFIVAGLSVSGTAHAESSIIILHGSGQSPSSVSVGQANMPSRSIIELGTTMPSIDTGKVAAIDASSEGSGHAMGLELMVIRGGEIGSVSPEPVAAASPDAATTQQAEAGEQVPMPATEGTAVDPAASATE